MLEYRGTTNKIIGSKSKMHRWSLNLFEKVIYVSKLLKQRMCPLNFRIVSHDVQILVICIELHVWYLYSECVMTCISHAGPHAISISLLSSPFSHTRTYSWPSPLGRHPALASFSSARLKVHQSTTMHCSNITTPLACIPHGISYWAYANYRNIQVLDEHSHATGFGKDGMWAQDRPWKGG